MAQAQFLGSSLAVIVKPRNGAAGRKLRISASGFTTGKRLYAHVVRGKYRHNVSIGKLKGPCRTTKARRRVLPAGLSTGVYTVQFDTKRRYSKKTKVWVKFRRDGHLVEVDPDGLVLEVGLQALAAVLAPHA